MFLLLSTKLKCVLANLTYQVRKSINYFRVKTMDLITESAVAAALLNDTGTMLYSNVQSA